MFFAAAGVRLHENRHLVNKRQTPRTAGLYADTTACAKVFVDHRQPLVQYHH